MYLPQALDSSAASSSLLEGRQLTRNRYTYRRRTPWSSWGRWVLAGILIAVALVLVFLMLCIRARRMKKNRKMGVTQAPIHSNNNHMGTQQPQMSSNVDNYGYSQPQQQTGYGGAPPPGPPPTYGGGANNGYYGQQSGVAQPQGAHFK